MDVQKKRREKTEARLRELAPAGSRNLPSVFYLMSAARAAAPPSCLFRTNSILVAK